MERRIINPWKWQDQFGFVQGVEITRADRVLYCAGQTSIDADGRAVHAGDMRAQIDQSFENLETVLAAAGYNLSNVVRINYYTTDVDAFVAAYEAGARLRAAGCRPSITLLGVARLAYPELLIEIEATAAK